VVAAYSAVHPNTDAQLTSVAAKAEKTPYLFMISLKKNKAVFSYWCCIFT
jgi:hypothetical protein